MENGKQQPLLSGDNCLIKQLPTAPNLDGGVEINGVGDFCREFYVESKRLWYLAGPVIFISLCQYTIGATTQLFAGQLGTIQLAAVFVQNSVIGSFSYSILYGLGSGLQTLCGQAYGAGKIEMLGIYLQRSWIILNTAALVLMFTYIFGVSVLRMLRQTTTISMAAGGFSVWMIPQLFAYATVIPTSKFLQAQSNIMAMALIAVLAVISHVFLSWLLIMKLGWGLPAAAAVLDGSWLFITMAQDQGKIIYLQAFRNLKGFVQLSFSSAVIYCLESWYMMSLVLFAGYFDNPEASVDALSVCLNILGWVCTASLGLDIAVSVRVSNELGYRRPRTARFSAIVVALTSLLIGLLVTTVLLVYKKEYPTFFTTSPEVMQLVEELTLLLGISVIAYSTQFTLSGVAIGAGWQTAVAYMNVGSCFFFGIPMSLLLGFELDMGIKGIWYRMVLGISMQCCLLLIMVFRTNWNEEANVARDRVKRWGGDIQAKQDEEERIVY